MIVGWSGGGESCEVTGKGAEKEDLLALHRYLNSGFQPENDGSQGM